MNNRLLPGLFVAAFLLATASLLRAQEYPLMLNTTVNAPYTASYVEYFQNPAQISVLVHNDFPGAVSHDIYLAGSITSINNTTGNISVSIEGGQAWNAPPLYIPVGFSALSGSDLEPFISNSSGQVHYEGIEEADIRLGLLPEGEYQICLQAFDYNTNEPLSMGAPSDGCSNIFTVTYPPPPDLLAPACGANVDGIQPQTLLFQWMLPSGPPIGALMQYHLKLVLLPEGDAIDPLSALESSNDPVWEGDVMTPQLLYTQLMDALIAGRRYAWYVRAVDATGQVLFQNNGWSEPCTFRWSGEGSFTLAYPLVNDTLPWDFLPIVARFDPYMGDITQFNSELTLIHVGGEQETYERDIVWASGPQLSQQAVLGIPISEDHARHINIYKRPGEPDVMYFESGEEHLVSAEITLSPDDGDPISGHIDGGFASGMGVPRMISPANDAHLARNGGDPEVSGYAPVPLRFKTAEPPARLLPPFRVIQNVDGESSQTDGKIYQRWRLDVSKSTDFVVRDSTISSRVGQLLNLLEEGCDESCMVAELYKEVEFDFTPDADGTYYWRVVWLTDPNSEFGEHYRASPTYKFTIGEGTDDEGETTEEERPRECVSVCQSPATPLVEQVAVANAVAMGDTVSVGLFKLRIATIAWAGGSANGDGLIDVPFMHCPLRVSFSNAQINAKKKLFTGDVFAKLDNESIVPAAWRMGAGVASGFSAGAVQAMDDYLNASGRLVNQLSGSTPMGLPIGIATDIPGGRFTVGIVGMRFTDTTATLNAMMSVPVPELGFNYGLGVSDQVFQPDGVGCPDKDALLYLVDAVRIGIGSDSLILKSTRFEPGNMINVLDSGTFAAWDCRGFRALQIDAEWRFSKDHLQEDRPDGTSGPDKIVASLKTRTGRGGFMGRVDFNKPFHIEGAEGWGFDVQEAWMDLASYANPPAMNLPPNVGQSVGAMNETNGPINTWRGFYLKRAMLRLPNEVKRFGSTERVTGVVDDLVIVGSQVTASFKLANLIGESEGELDGWAFSLDTLQFDIVSNSFSQAGIKGRMRTAISPTLLDYSAMLRQSPTSSRKWLEFLLQPEENLPVPFLVATVTLDETSTVRAALGDPELGNYAKATLNGRISIDQQLGSIPINFHDIKFQGLRFQTRAPYTNIDSTAVFSLASPQKYLGATEVMDDDDPLTPAPEGTTGGFPISLTRVEGTRTTIDGNPAAGIAFDINLKLTGETNIFQATTRIEVLGTLNTSEIHQWGNNEVRLDSIGITGGVSTVEVSGGLKWYRDSPTYGNGIKGSLRAKFMKGKIDILANAQFGTVGTNKYWYVDAMAAKAGGWNKPSAFTIYGFGGGAWYHMSPLSATPPAENITEQELTHLNDDDFEPGLTLSGMNYTPNAAIDLGFKATIVFGDPSSGYAYNGNITALAQFAGGGLQSIGLTTDVFMLHKKEVDGTIQGHVPINGHGEILFVFATDVFTANFDMYVDLRPNLLVGVGPNKLAGRLEVMITPDTWHFYVGRPDSRVGLKIAGFLQTTSYFMVGHGLPGIPAPPPELASLVPADYLVREDISDASGLAFGSEISFSDTSEFLVFRTKVNGKAGFDLLFTSSSSMVCDGIEDPGIGPFYARGQLYAAINAAVSLFVDIGPFDGEYDIFSVGVSGMFQCGFANPSWLKGFAHGEFSILGGLASGEATVPFEAGSVCQPPQSSMLDLDPIGDLSPADRSGLPPGCNDFLICGVDCGVEPQAVFNMKVNSQFSFNEVTADHQLIPHTVRIVIDKFELKNEYGTVVACNPNLAGDHTRVSLHPHAYLPPKKQYTIHIKLRAEELKNGVWGPPAISATWERTHTFKTDGGLEALTADNIDYTYPFYRQRFVLQDECRNGVIACNGDMHEQPVFRSPYGKRRNFKIVITSLSGGAPMMQDVTPTHNGNSSIAFTLPQLANKTTYSVKLVARDEFDGSNLAVSGDGPTSPPQGQGQLPGQQAAMVNTQTMSMGAVASSSVSSNLGMVHQMNRTIEGYALRPDEKLLYEYHFRTSQYNTLPEKVIALVNTSTEYTANTQTPPKETLIPSFSGEEFDVYDLVGFEYGEQDGEVQMYPLIGVQDAKSDPWHKQFAKPLMYDYYQAIRASYCSALQLARTVTMSMNGGFLPTTTIRDFPDPIGIPPYNTVRFHPDGPRPAPMLNASETAPSTNSQMGHGTWEVSGDGPSTGPPLNVRLQFKTADWVRDDYVRLQTITPDVISNCGPVTHNSHGDDVFHEMPEPLRSYVIAFQNTPYKLMFRGAYGATFYFNPPPTCFQFSDGPRNMLDFSNGTATFQHPTGSTPPVQHAPGTGTGSGTGTGTQIH